MDLPYANSELSFRVIIHADFLVYGGFVMNEYMHFFPYNIIVPTIYFLVLWDHNLILNQFEKSISLKPVLGVVSSVAP